MIEKEMENKIEVGEYVRTKSGIIGTVIKISEAGSGTRYAGEFRTDTIISIYTRPHTEVRLKERDIIKHSKNIIDLIEKGDYVNGKYVEKIEQYKSGKSIIALIGIIDEKDIKSIVTKEQFESVEYKN